MQLTLLSPRKSLNKAWLKVKPCRRDIEFFKTNLIKLLDSLDESETEEHVKNDLSDFLRNIFCQKFYINTQGRNDLVIHNGPDAKSGAGVLIEAKKPSNKPEMIQPDNLNTKAFHELILYYLRERILNHNLEIKHLVATNIYEWYVFDANLFEKLFAQNKNLVKQFTVFEEGRLSGKTTDFFYKEIAEPLLAGLTCEICFTMFDFREYEKLLRNDDQKDDSKLIALYKLLSPEHLLKIPFSNDSNSLDKGFYAELLHIIGLTEMREGNKKLIGRKTDSQRDAGSLLENAIIQIDSLDIISRLEKPSRFGENNQERLFNVSLELVITWINRILFLKLLEAQLIRYNKGNAGYSFLSVEKMKGFDSLNSLFFRVLAKKVKDRDPAAAKLFEKVPYLNSSLFEPTELERETIFISNLQDECQIPVHSGSVLKNSSGKRLTGTLNGLDYLLTFLDAFDFSGEGAEEIQEENKTLINSSVLGLIFEKINGYKDGSFFTPGFITMYMCRETIRRAVAQKFKDMKGWDCQNLDELYDKIEDKKEANDIVNSLKICDPAVGSGHYLVSALNEIIAIKGELKILSDKSGKRLKEYHVEVANDELIVTDEDGKLFEYNPKSPESQRVQEAIFHEKQTIIENCLFGVDINPNSVKICRLRLWIELLKSAYYKSPHPPATSAKGEEERELETLPNIDINIKCGNSLISRYALDADLKQVLSVGRFSILSYRAAIMTYRNAENKEQKLEMERLIAKIKSAIHLGIGANDPRIKKRDQILSKIIHKFSGNFLFEPETVYGDEKAKEKGVMERQRLEEEATELNRQIEESKNNRIYDNAFEWRYEFPEALNDDGDFIGFDVVIGNPPYVDIKAINGELVNYYFHEFKTTANRINLFSIFVELGYSILHPNGEFIFIIPNSILVNSSYQELRNLIVKDIHTVVKLPDKVFPGAIVETIILAFKKQKEVNVIDVIRYSNTPQIDFIDKNLSYQVNKNTWYIFNEVKFNIYLTESTQSIINKCHNDIIPLGQIAELSLGLTPYDKYKGHSKTLIGNREYHSNVQRDNTYKPLIKGENIVRYKVTDDIKEYIKYGDWLGAPREEKFFNAKRVIVRQIVSGKPPRIYAGYTDKALYFTQIGFAIIPFAKISAKALTGLLNSKLMNFIHKFMYLDIEKELFQKILIENCKQLPIKSMGEHIQRLIEINVDEIINESPDSIVFEQNIDQIVYNVYGLTADEIKIIEQSF
ncbi:MAG: N-6 DNA methylase [Bacteroidetes bacterium]|nr:N-6 DNA methylase [Bacteroidota bacterium]